MPTGLTRRQAIHTAAAPALLTTRVAAQPSAPNILWISSEDTSPDLGCYSDPYASTPNLDKLATEGARYTHAFSVYGVCAPSRSSIITGMYPTAIGTCHMRSQGVPPSYVKCFTEYLRAAGYYCSNNSKTDYNLGQPNQIQAWPLTAWDDCSNKAHWRNRGSNTPFFSVINLTVSHESQARADEATLQKYRAQLKPGQVHDPAKAVLPPYYADTPAVRQNWANYYDTVSLMDQQAGQILKQLEEDGLASNTIVFYWGDHGRGLTRGKRWVYDSGIRVPLIIRWPGKLRPGSVENRMVSLMDLGPTVLSLAGVKPPDYMHGRAFLGIHEAAPRKYIFAARDRMDETYDTIRAVRDSRYKYIRNYHPERPYAQYIEYMDQMPILKEMRRLHKEGSLNAAQALWFAPSKPVEELYDCEKDPHEINNLAGRPEAKAKLEELRAAHLQWLKDQPDLGQLPEAELKAKMRPSGKWEETAAPEILVQNGEVTLRCTTEGSSIAWTTEEGPTARWRLYVKPFPAPANKTLRVRAIRLGFRNSPEASRAV
jgi:uncharacterized sulfatase